MLHSAAAIALTSPLFIPHCSYRWSNLSEWISITLLSAAYSVELCSKQQQQQQRSYTGNRGHGGHSNWSWKWLLIKIWEEFMEITNCLWLNISSDRHTSMISRGQLHFTGVFTALFLLFLHFQKCHLHFPFPAASGCSSYRTRPGRSLPAAAPASHRAGFPTAPHRSPLGQELQSDSFTFQTAALTNKW